MAGTGDSPNVLLVTVDCMRRDRISAYGHPNPTTPFLDSLIDGSGLHCTSAHAAAPWTAPSVASLLSGLYPHNHRAGLLSGEPRNLSRDDLPTKLPDEVPLLQDMLPGHSAASFVTVWSAALPVQGRIGDLRAIAEPASRVAKRALAWMRAQDGGSFVCWVHLRGGHDPLTVPRDLRVAFGPVDYRRARKWDFTRRDVDLSTPAFLAYRSERERLYDAAILSADASIRVLWEGLGDLRHRTVLVVTADHGEELWEHRDEEVESFADPRGLAGVGHGHSLFQVLLLVPLVFSGPGIPPGAVEHSCSLVDVVPTVLEAVGVDAPTMDGVSLLHDQRERPVTAQGMAYGYEKRAVVFGDSKLVVSPGDDYERAFRLGEARLEEGPVEDAALLERLRPLLPPDAVASGNRVEPTAEIEEHLRGLGYLE